MKEQLVEFLDHLRLNENASAHTVRAYESDLLQFISFVAAHLVRRRSELAASDFSQIHIRAFLGDLHKRGNSRSSAARKLAAIRTFGRYMRREGAIDGDPAALVGTPKREQRLPAHLGESEMSRLLEMPDGSTPLGRRDRAIMELFYASGLRLSELVGLGFEDVNLSSRVVRVLGKGGKERIVPFNRTTESALRAWIKDREDIVADVPEAGTVLRRGAKLRRSAEPLFLNYRGGTTLDAERRPPGAPLRVGVQRAIWNQPARTPALIRHALARTRGRPSRDPGTARPRAPEHDPALHARQLRAITRRLQEVAPESVAILRLRWAPSSAAARRASNRCRAS